MADDVMDWLDELDGVPEVHTIVAVSRSADFVEWSCATCGRRVRVAHAGGLTVLDAGDRSVLHRGGDGVQLSGASTSAPTPRPPETIH